MNFFYTFQYKFRQISSHPSPQLSPKVPAHFRILNKLLWSPSIYMLSNLLQVLSIHLRLYVNHFVQLIVQLLFNQWHSIMSDFWRLACGSTATNHVNNDIAFRAWFYFKHLVGIDLHTLLFNEDVQLDLAL